MRVFFKADFFPAPGEEGTLLMDSWEDVRFQVAAFNKVLGLMLNDGGRFAACCPTKVMRVTVSRTERHCFKCTT